MQPPPARIASLLASATEILYALGLGDRVVAVSHECDYPREATLKPRVTRTLVAAETSSRDIDRQVQAMAAGQTALYEIDVPRLAALRPELIVTQAQCDVCAVRLDDVLSAVANVPELSGARVVALNPASLSDIFADILRVGEAAGCPAAADAYVAALRQRVAAVQSQTATIPPQHRPRVVCLEWLEPLMVAGNWLPEMIELAGGQNRLTEAGRHSPYVEWPAIVAEDPQVLLLAPCGFDLPRTLREAEVLPRLPGWRQVAAVRTGRVFAVDGNAYFNRSGPRMVDSLEILAHLLQPELFAPPSISGERPWRVLPQ
jgi:iron complex transport system substrate-binding protein